MPWVHFPGFLQCYQFLIWGKTLLHYFHKDKKTHHHMHFAVRIWSPQEKLPAIYMNYEK